MKNATPTSTARTVSFSENAMTIISFFLFLMIPDAVFSFFTVVSNFNGYSIWKKCTGFFNFKTEKLEAAENSNPCPDENVAQKEKEPWQRSMLLATLLCSTAPQWLTILNIIQTAKGFHIPLFAEHEHQRRQTYADFVKKITTVPLLQLTRFDYKNGIAVPCRPHLSTALQFLNTLYVEKENENSRALIQKQIAQFYSDIVEKYLNDATAPERFTAYVKEFAPDIYKDTNIVQ